MITPNYVETFPKTFDNTTISTYQTCPRKFEYFILNGLRNKTTARSLTFGQAVHLGLATWYQHIQTSAEDRRAALAKLWADIEANPARVHFAPWLKPVEEIHVTELRSTLAIWAAFHSFPPPAENQLNDHRDYRLLFNLLSGYFKQYPYEPFEVLYVEQNFVFELFAGGPLYSGIIDLVVRWNNLVVPIEHKTTSQLYNFGDTFTPNQQVTGYLSGLHTLVEEAANFIVVNALGLAKRKDRTVKPEDFERFTGIYRTETQMREFLDNCINLLQDMQKDLQRGYFAQNTTACHQYGGCPYKTICNAAPGRERQLVIEHYYAQDFWNPLTRDEH